MTRARPPNRLLALALLLGGLVGSLLWPGLAAAHVTGTGVATLEVDGRRLSYRLVMVATEVDDPAGRLLWHAAEGDRAAADRVGGFLRAYARFAIGGEPCRPERLAIGRSAAGADRVVLEMALACFHDGPVLAIEDDWPEVLGAHFQTVLSVRRPGRPSVELAFVEDRRRATVDLAAPAAAGWTGFVRMGITHILGGPDHLLFLVALLAFAPGLWPTIRIVTAFTVAHSITLSLAVLGAVDVPSDVVEPLIAASIVAVAVENLVAGDRWVRRWVRRWALAGLFGLVHGLGFASALTELELPRTALVRALVGFNVGVELGQLAFIAVLLPLLVMARRAPRLARLPQALSLAVALAGAAWLVARLADALT